MKTLLTSTILLASVCGLALTSNAQTKPAPVLTIAKGAGNGLRFAESDAYKISLGNTPEYRMGPVLGTSLKSNMDTIPGSGWTWGAADKIPVAGLTNNGIFQLKNRILIDPVNPRILIGSVGSYPSAELSMLGLTLRDEGDPYCKRLQLSNEKLVFTKNVPAPMYYHTTEIGHGSLLVKYVPNSNVNSFQLLTIDKGDLYTTGRIGIGMQPTASLAILGNVHVRTNKDTTVAPDFIINDKGYISIGTDKVFSMKSELFKLSVNGKIACKELKVDAKWADYVFADDYQLRRLSEVEQFIKENKHLPDVPSAASVESEGLAVGEMQAVMMQKIEELTLYMIKLEKDNLALRAEMANLKTTTTK